jgi:hypothetical protein
MTKAACCAGSAPRCATRSKKDAVALVDRSVGFLGHDRGFMDRIVGKSDGFRKLGYGMGVWLGLGLMSGLGVCFCLAAACV